MGENRKSKILCSQFIVTYAHLDQNFKALACHLKGSFKKSSANSIPQIGVSYKKKEERDFQHWKCISFFGRTQ